MTGGNTTGDGFHVRRLLIETRPGYWCPAALFMPDNADGRPIPAVLFPSGHSDLTFREPASQIVSMNLVKRGFAVMGFGKSDRIESSVRDSLTNGNASLQIRSAKARGGCFPTLTAQAGM